MFIGKEHEGATNNNTGKTTTANRIISVMVKEHRSLLKKKRMQT